jgi:putative aldouronate transport system permease protein
VKDVRISTAGHPAPGRKRGLWFNLVRYRFLYLLILPALLVYLVYSYIPMYGVIIAFQDYKPHLGLEGMFAKARWVGLKHFRTFIDSFYFGRLMTNTLRISLLKLLFGFPAPVILALFLNEIRQLRYKKLVQTVSYLPHFLSWVVLSGILRALLSHSDGTVNYIIESLGGQPVNFLNSNATFIWVLVFSSVWQSVGWGSIIYLATLAGVDPQLYESAVLDGASRFQQMRYISLPMLYNIMSIQLILSMGGILNAGFEQVLMLYNELVYETGDIIDTFVYRAGIVDLKYSFSTAVGLFKTAIGFVMMMLANYAATKLGRESLF